jgi:hypothetical protein
LPLPSCTGARQAAAREALAVLPQLDRQLEVLATAVAQLDKRSRQLERRLGVGSSKGSGSSGAAFLLSSMSQLTAQVGGVPSGGAAAAAAGLVGCLTGGSSSASGASSSQAPS